MKNNLLVALLGLALAAGCVDSSVRSVEIKACPLKDGSCVHECAKDSEGTVGVKGAGIVDLKVTKVYYLGLQLTSRLSKDEAMETGSTLSNANDFMISEMTLEYACAGSAIECQYFPGGDNLPPQTQLLALDLSAGGSLSAEVNLLTSEVTSKLTAWRSDPIKAVDVPPENPVQILVTVTFKGELRGGGSFETAPYKFPLGVYLQGVPDCSGADGQWGTSDDQTLAVYPPAYATCLGLIGQDSELYCAVKTSGGTSTD